MTYAANTHGKKRLAAVGDLHCRSDQNGRFRELCKMINGEADVLILCGDLTDRGLRDEGQALADALATLTVPCLAVLGNHDHDHGASAEIEHLLAAAGVTMLDGDHEVLFDGELGIAGVKGFGGGFGSGTLQAFGETPIKAYVQEAVNESLKLESALGQLDTDRKVVMMHYAPIVETTVGENPEIRPYLGTSRLEAPIDLYGANAVFHGHAHHGAAEGRTAKGVPVYNVAMPLLRKLCDRQFIVVDI
jgi:Icc-related predicted phosphoesterase